MALVTRSTENTQISCAIKASNELVKNLHRDGLDHEASLYRSLTGLKNYVSGSTRLYDSIVDIIKTFHSNGDRTRPWILVVVTDGDDTGSNLSLLKSASEISRLFTKDSSNFLFVVGVGDDVDSTKMEQA
ncbi:3228_t:CDS:2 [Racocetra fulgida]|uniref:3228_t:CDS:1 n=1 Tax=Racocetra fulgida TaxID=60492 RepID=A0A9N9BRH9_9GLOM|nr:3228_t:CDS:2 [Racocetra fulgida]